MRKQRRTAITSQGWCYLLLVAFVLTWAILQEANLLLIVGGILLGPLVCSWRLVRVGLQGVEVRRKMPRAVYAREPLTVAIECSCRLASGSRPQAPRRRQNARKRFGSWAVRVVDQVRRDDGAGDPGPGAAQDRQFHGVDAHAPAASHDSPVPDCLLRPATFFWYVAPGDSQERTFHGRFPERGRYWFGPLEVSTRFPFGLLRQTITLGQTEPLTVYPRLGRLMPAWTARHQEALQGPRGGRRPGRAPGDFCGVREWQAGDSLRWVHWRSTARHGEVVVCQFEQPRRRDIALLVELWQPPQPAPEHLENVELAVSFAATLVADVCRRGGNHLLVGITGPEPDLTAGFPATPLMEQALERLAVAKASRHEQLTALVEAATERLGPGTEMLLVSTRSHRLRHAHRFGAWWADPSAEGRPGAIRVVSTADPGFTEYFQAD